MKFSALGLITALVLLLTAACVSYPDYGHGSAGADTIPMTAPFRGGGSGYVGETLAGVQVALGTLYNDDDFNGLARAWLQRGDNLGWVGFTYGVSGFGGLYTAASGTRSYFGGSVHASAVFIIPFEALELRLLGFQIAASYEGGEYHEFRRTAEFITNEAPDPFLIGFGVFTEACFRLGDASRLGIRVCLGGTQSDFQGGADPLPTGGLAAYLTLDPVTVWFQAEEIIFEDRPALSLGVAYRIL